MDTAMQAAGLLRLRYDRGHELKLQEAFGVVVSGTAPNMPHTLASDKFQVENASGSTGILKDACAIVWS